MQLDKETKLKQEKERCRQLAQRVAEEARPASAQVLNSESDLLEKALRRAGIRAEEWSAQAAEPVDLLVVEDPVWSHLPQQLPEKVLLASVDSTMMAAWAEQLARRGYYRDFRWRSKGRAQQSALFCTGSAVPAPLMMVQGYEQEMDTLRDRMVRAERTCSEEAALIERLRSDLALSRSHEQQLEKTLSDVTNSTFWKLTWPMRYAVSKSRQIWHTFPLFVFLHDLRAMGVEGVREQARARREYAVLFPSKTLRADRFAPVELLVKQVSHQPGGDQRAVHRRRRQQRRDRHALFRHIAVGEHQNPAVLPHRLDCVAGELFQREFQYRAVAPRRELHRQHAGLEILPADPFEPRELVVGQHRAVQLDQPGVRRSFGEDVAPVADVSGQAHHQLLADRVDRRIGDLREQLFEVVEQQLRLVRQHRQRRVVAHRTDRLLAGGGHRLDDQFDILAGVAETLLHRDEIVPQLRRGDFGEQPVHRNLVLLHPAPVGAAAGGAVLKLAVVDQPVVLQIEVDHLARTQPPLAHHLVRREIQHAGFGGQHEYAVFAQRVARRAQPVAVEDRARIHAVGKRDCGRPVPRLHQRRMVFKKAAHVASEVVVFTPRLRHQHQHRVRQRAAGGDQEFKHIVEAGRIALPFRDQRQQFAHVVAEQFAGEERFAGAQLVQVAAQGVDLAVVGEVAERMRQIPRRESIGTVTLMNQRQRRLEAFIAEVGIEFFQLGRQQQPLVDDAAARHAADVALRHALFDQAAHHIELALQFGLRMESAAVDEKLADRRARFPRRPPDLAGIHRHVAPCEHPAPLGSDDFFDGGFPARSAEDHRDAVFPRLRQLAAEFGAEKLIRQRQQQPRSVAGIRVAARRAAVHQPLQDRHSHPDDPVARHIVQVRDEADAARVVFVRKAVESGIRHRRRCKSLLGLLSIHFHGFRAPSSFGPKTFFDRKSKKRAKLIPRRKTPSRSSRFLQNCKRPGHSFTIL